MPNNFLCHLLEVGFYLIILLGGEVEGVVVEVEEVEVEEVEKVEEVEEGEEVEEVEEGEEVEGEVEVEGAGEEVDHSLEVDLGYQQEAFGSYLQGRRWERNLSEG